MINNNHTLFIFLTLLFGLLSCSMKKVTEVNIQNENDFPVRVTMVTNNVRETFPVLQPHTDWTGEFDWTRIEKKDGQWLIYVTDLRSGGTDSFAHGFFTQGELAGYAELICSGSQLKIKISE